MEEIEYLFDILHYGPNYSTRLKFDHNQFKRHKNNKNREVTKSTSTLANEIIVSMSKVLLIVCLFSFHLILEKRNQMLQQTQIILRAISSYGRLRKSISIFSKN